MNSQIKHLDDLCKTLHLNARPPAEFLQDMPESCTPFDTLTSFLELQLCHKQEQAACSRIKKACFPQIKTIDDYDFSQQEGVSAGQMKRLYEFIWLEQAFNIVFLGAPGVGKTHLATSIGVAAAKVGYQVAFITLENLIRLLKTEEISASGRKRLKFIRKASLVILDEGKRQMQPDLAYLMVSGFFPTHSLNAMDILDLNSSSDRLRSVPRSYA